MTYKSLIFTTHALNRSKQRHLQPADIYQVVKFPEQTISLDQGKLKSIKKIGGRQIQVVTAPAREANKLLVISVWVRGEEDQKSLLSQIFQSLKRLIKFAFTAKTA